MFDLSSWTLCLPLLQLGRAWAIHSQSLRQKALEIVGGHWCCVRVVARVEIRETKERKWSWLVRDPSSEWVFRGTLGS